MKYSSVVSRLILITFLLASSLLLVGVTGSRSHEHQINETPEQARTIEWLKTWKRPKGPYGIQHRAGSCCYYSGLQQDCFPVKETKVIEGTIWVFPDTEGHPEYANWYLIPPGISEVEQPDPRESPDGRAYVCVAGSNVICYVPGGGT